MRQIDIVRTVARMSDANRIGLDSHLNGLRKEIATAKRANLHGIKHRHELTAPGTRDSNDVDLTIALKHLLEQHAELEEFLQACLEDRVCKRLERERDREVKF